jgi:cell wall-active antibiotic response 4TMS protein YvqF
VNDSHSNRHFVVGVVVLLLGLILLLDQLGFTDANIVFRFWPLILIYFGVRKLSNSYDLTGRFWGGFLTLLGIAFQLEELGFSHIRFGTVWPVFLICIGVLLILRRYEYRSRHYGPPPSGPDAPVNPGPIPSPSGAPEPQAPPQAQSSQEAQTSPQGQAPPQAQAPPGAQAPPQTQWNFSGDYGPNAWQQSAQWNQFQRRMDRASRRFQRGMDRTSYHFNQNWHDPSGWHDSSEPRLNDVNVFWGGRRRITSKNFTGGEIVAIFGGFEIDLSEADLQGNEAEIEIVTIFGGGEIRIPENWDVVVDSVGIFGGTGDRTRHPDPRNQAQAPGTSTSPPVKRLVIKGVSIFGGLTLKN